jgi:hypothetical protein
MLTLIIINGFPQYSGYQLLGYLQPGEKPGVRYVQEWRSWENSRGPRYSEERWEGDWQDIAQDFN